MEGLVERESGRQGMGESLRQGGQSGTEGAVGAGEAEEWSAAQK